MFQRKWASAVVLTLLSGAAAAQSTVTIYGRLDTGIVTGKFDSTGNRTLVQSGPYTASRLGFRGTEDLGGGLRASFGLEAGLNIDTGTGGATGGGINFNRGSQVALASDNWGEFALGKMYMPTFWVYLGSDPGIGGLGLGSMGASIMQQHTALTGKTGWGGFYDNTVRYRTPNMSGLKGEIAYSLGSENASNSAAKNDGKTAGLNVQYEQGAMYLGGAYQKYTASIAGTTAGTYIGDVNQTTWMLAGRYKIAPATVGVNYGRTKNSTACLATGNAVGCDMNTFAINSRFDLTGQSSMDLSWSQLKANSGSLSGAKANTLAIGYTYYLSKRTWVYGQAVKMNNNSLSKWGLNGGLGIANDTKGLSPQAFSIGVLHMF